MYCKHNGMFFTKATANCVLEFHTPSVQLLRRGTGSLFVI